MASNQSTLIPLILLGSVAFLIQRSSALSCLPCYEVDCTTDTTACAYGITSDICGCCDECAKGPGEECGGIWNHKLSCGKGLKCISSKIHQDMPGVCKPKP